MFLKAIKQGPLADIRQSGIFVALGVIIALFTILTKGALLSPRTSATSSRRTRTC